MSVFWIHAATAERMEKAYQEIAKKAGLIGAEDPKVDQFQLVKQWLEGEDSGNWLMIIDNADDEKLFFGEAEDQNQGSFSSSGKLTQFFPQRPNGSILLTTRNRMVGVRFATARGVIIIPEMSVSESKNLLVESLEEGSYDDDDLTELVDVLEHLPLALVQAAAFIGEKSQSIGEYLQTYRGSDSSKIKLLSQNFEDSERDPDIKNPVAVTWAISFEQIRRNDQQAARLLSLMSVLDRQAIPKSLLLSDIEEVELDIALGTLKAFSLITVEQNRQAFTLHRLVYLATRNWLNINKELEFWTGEALVLLSELFPTDIYENQEIGMAYLPHAHTVLNSAQLPAKENIAQASLLFNVSWALQEKGDYNLAEIMAQRCLDLRQKFLGEKHYETLLSLSNLGKVLWRKGENEKAEDIHQQALNSFEEMLGKDHPFTIRSLGSLALVLGNQGKYDAAEELYRQVLSAYEKTPGKEHFDTLRNVNNLGNVLAAQGKYEAAEALHRQALSVREKTLGKEHPDTLRSVDNLGLVLSYQGKYEEAEKLHRQALSGRERLLGEEHHDTLVSVWGLADLFASQRQYQTALQLYQRALAGFKEKLGPDHPHTRGSAEAYEKMLEDMSQDSEAPNPSVIGEDS